LTRGNIKTFLSPALLAVEEIAEEEKDPIPAVFKAGLNSAFSALLSCRLLNSVNKI